MAFASTVDIAARLQSAALSAGETAAAELLLELASGVIAESVDKDEDWITETESYVPRIIRFLTIEAVCRAMASPQGLKAASETLGAYTRSETYRDDLSSALMLTEYETLMARRSVYGTNAGSAKAETVISEFVGPS